VGSSAPVDCAQRIGSFMSVLATLGVDGSIGVDGSAAARSMRSS
jgi:hypothetical protein